MVDYLITMVKFCSFKAYGVRTYYGLHTMNLTLWSPESGLSNFYFYVPRGMPCRQFLLFRDVLFGVKIYKTILPPTWAQPLWTSASCEAVAIFGIQGECDAVSDYSSR